MKYLEKVEIVENSIYISTNGISFNNLKSAIDDSSEEGFIRIENDSAKNYYPSEIFSLRYKDVYPIIAQIASVRYLHFNKDMILYEEIMINKSKFSRDENIFDFEFMYGDTEISIHDTVEFDEKYSIGFHTFYDFNTGIKIESFDKENILNSRFVGNRTLGPLCLSFDPILEDEYIPLGLLKKVGS